MSVRKETVIAVLITFCLTATLFAITPTKSGNGSSYDPWKDINDDGVVDSTDLGMLGTAWGTTGDPTKNVNMKRSYYTSQIYFDDIPVGDYRSLINITAGYNRVTVFIINYGINASIEVLFGIEQTCFTVDIFTLKAPPQAWVHKVYDVLGDKIIVCVRNIGTNIGDAMIFLYVTA